MEDMNKIAEAHSGCGCGCGQAADQAANEACSVDSHKETPVEKVERDAGATYLPAVDIIDGANEAVLVLDMPGVRESDIDLTLEKSVLTIKARPAESMFEGKGLIYSEYGVGDFRRSFSLTEDIDADGIVASLKDGVLKVTLPKRAPVTKKINVGADA